MSGHSKWSTIKRKKGAADAKRGRLFTRLIKEITIAARLGGGDVNANPRLRLAVDNAKMNSMPKENIERAIKKGIGQLAGENYEEYTYEGYGPGGVAFLLEVLTDNKNRTGADIRHLFSKHGGSLGEVGCVAYMFHKRGRLAFEKEKFTEEAIMDMALAAGAEDVVDLDEVWEVLTDSKTFMQVKAEMDQKGVSYIEADLTMIPDNTLTVSGDMVAKVLRLIEVLEDHDDVQNVYTNLDISDEEIARLSS